MKATKNMKVPFGPATMTEISHVRYLPWEDAFDVEFEDGICFLEPHAAIRTANGISKKATVAHIVPDDECHIGFEIHYDTNEVAEVSWSFIQEFPPGNA